VFHHVATGLSVLLVVVCCGRAPADVAAVETRIAVEEGARGDHLIEVVHRLSGVSGTVQVPVPAYATDLEVAWPGDWEVLAEAELLDPVPAIFAYPDHDVVRLRGDGDLATVRYAYRKGADDPLREPLGAARIHRDEAVVACAVDVPEGWIPFSPSHDLAGTTLFATPEDPLPDRPLIVLDLRPEPGRPDIATCFHRREGGAGGRLLIAATGRQSPGWDSRPRRVAFALDVSASMRGEKLARAKECIRDATRMLGSGDSFHLVTFAERVRVHPVDPRGAGLERLLRSLEAGGKANLAGALTRIGEEGLDVDAVVVLTDGRPTAGITDAEGIRAAIGMAYGESPISFHAIGFGADVDAARLDVIANAYDGEVVYVDDRADVRLAAARTLERLGNPVARDVRVELVPVDGAPGGSRHVDFGALYAGDVRVRIVEVPVVDRIEARLRWLGVEGEERREARAMHLVGRGHPAHRVIENLWARRRIAEIEGPGLGGADPGGAEVREACLLAVREGIVHTTALPLYRALAEDGDPVAAYRAYRDRLLRPDAAMAGEDAPGPAIARARNWRALLAARHPPRWTWDDRGRRVPVRKFVYEGTGCRAVRVGDDWIDAEILVERLRLASGDPPVRYRRETTAVSRDGPEWPGLLRIAKARGKSEMLTLGGRVTVRIDGTDFEVAP